MFDNIKSDLERNKGNKKGVFVVMFFRITHFFCIRRDNIFYNIIGIPFRVLYRLIVEWIMGIEIPASTIIGRGLVIHHGQGLVIHANTIIGDHVTLKHNTTIGTKEQGHNSGVPTIGDNVTIHPHVVIFGGVNVSSNAVIGAGSIINKNVEPNAIVVGNPQKVIGYVD